MSNGKADPQGQAALMLCESLVHVLVERGVISLREALEAVDTAAEAKGGAGDDVDPRSLSLLRAIGSSLGTGNAP